jgi:hypothetical protein
LIRNLFAKELDMKLAYKYDVHGDNGVNLVANSLKVARQYKKEIRAAGSEAYIVKQQYMPIFGKVVS